MPVTKLGYFYLTHGLFELQVKPKLLGHLYPFGFVVQTYKHTIYRVAIFPLEKLFKLKNFQTIDGFTETTFAVLTCG